MVSINGYFVDLTDNFTKATNNYVLVVQSRD